MQMLRSLDMHDGRSSVDGSDAYRNKFKLSNRFKISMWSYGDAQSKVVCVKQCAHSPAAGLMTCEALSGPPDQTSRSDVLLQPMRCCSVMRPDGAAPLLPLKMTSRPDTDFIDQKRWEF